MSCLLPQFKCQPDILAVNFRLPKCRLHTFRRKEVVKFRTRCVLTTTSLSTTIATSVLDIEKLKLSSSLEDIPSSVPDERSWLEPVSAIKAAMIELEKLPSLNAHPIADKMRRYIRDAGLHSEVNDVVDKKAILTSEEASIVAAASEAVALAKAAVKVAKDAALIVNDHKSRRSSGLETTTTSSAVVETSVLNRSHLANSMENHSLRGSNSEITRDWLDTDSYADDADPSAEELEILEVEVSQSVTVRSNRQMERKARRTRAAQKAAANIMSMKPTTLSRKKRSAVQEVDYSDPLRYLRGVTNSSRLLTASEEQEMSEGIQVLLKLERIQEELRKRLGSGPLFSQWAAAAGLDQQTLRKQLNYGSLCKDKMIKSNIRLVVSIAKNYQGCGMNLQDLIQEGCRGLVRGAEKFDASKGFKFSTYAHWWIKQAVRKALSDHSRTIRLPFHLVEAGYRVKEARKQLYSENGRQPNDEEVAEATGLTMKRLSAVMSTPKAPISLDQKIGINEDLKPSEMIADPEAETAEEILIKQFMKQDMLKVLDTLNPREKQVVRLRFGLEDGRMNTLQEIGEQMGVSRERIRQIESCAFRKLKNKKRTMVLQQYVMP